MTALAWLAGTIALLALIFVIASMLFFRDRTEPDDMAQSQGDVPRQEGRS